MSQPETTPSPRGGSATPCICRRTDRRRHPDLPTRLSRARLVYLLGRSGQPLSDWLPLGLAAAVIGLMFLGGSGMP